MSVNVGEILAELPASATGEEWKRGLRATLRAERNVGIVARGWDKRGLECPACADLDIRPEPGCEFCDAVWLLEEEELDEESAEAMEEWLREETGLRAEELRP